MTGGRRRSPRRGARLIVRCRCAIHRVRSQVPLDLEPLAVQDLPFLVRDADRRELSRPVPRRAAAAAAIEPGWPVHWAAVARPMAASRSSIACASALTVRCAADVVRRLAIAARARVDQLRLARDQQIHRVDEDVEPRPWSRIIRSGTRDRSSRPPTRASQRAGLDIAAGAGSRSDIETGVAARPGRGRRRPRSYARAPPPAGRGHRSSRMREAHPFARSRTLRGRRAVPPAGRSTDSPGRPRARPPMDMSSARPQTLGHPPITPGTIRAREASPAGSRLRGPCPGAGEQHQRNAPMSGYKTPATRTIQMTDPNATPRNMIWRDAGTAPEEQGARPPQCGRQDLPGEPRAEGHQAPRGSPRLCLGRNECATACPRRRRIRRRRTNGPGGASMSSAS